MSPISIPFYSTEESLRLITGKWKLTGQNFPVWKLHLQNVLSAQGKLYVINKPMSRPKSNAPEEEFAEYFRFMADESEVMSILVFSMSPEFTGDLRVKFCHEVVRNVENQLGFYKHTGKLLIMQEILSLKLQKAKYVQDLLKRFDFGGSNSAATPMPRNFQLTADTSGKPVDQKTYRAIIGSLLYLTASRPDIVFSTGVCARFQCDPRDSHLSAVKRILRYLKGTPIPKDQS
ncbi:hypothetical protein OSB04_024668 [Centaurea solstitialis]|uniref:Mitochondrial protein n=1 Tax=Centaurea solstitialis TaxID=347529 RepID=A0AA38SY96_9ASTR|nr:hypothetical protein OSB04_024668 [Centaurea solstitialis]